MDDLLDLNWSGGNSNNSKSTPPNIPHKPSYLAGNRTVPTTKNKDAFADLLNMSSQNAPNRSKLSLAEQQRLLRQQASLSSSPSLSARSSSPAQKLATSVDSLLDPFSGKHSGPPSTANMPMDSLRSSSRGFDSPTTQEQQNMQWNFDFLERTTPSSSPIITDPFDPASLPVRQSAPPAFEDEGDDNPLGILSKPAQKTRSPSPPPPSSAPDHSPSPLRSRSRASSAQVPAVGAYDMFVAQLVDMGFSIEQAHVAVEATGGNDLQLAIDLLVQNTEAVKIQDKPRRRQEREQSYTDTARARQALFDDYDDENQNEHTPRKAQGLRHQHGNDSNGDHPRRGMTEEDAAASNAPFQQQKEKLVAQATELGGFLYKNASMFVKAGRQRVSKAVEDWQEQQRADQNYRESGRPRWMREGALDEDDQMAPQEQYPERFADDNSSDEDPELEKQRELAWKQQQEAKQREYAIRTRRQQQQRQILKQEEEAYVSPSRRRNAAPSSRKPSTASSPTSFQDNASSPSKPNKRPRARPLVSAAPDAMARANAARQLGNEKFKLGQFGEAEMAYSQAISVLPPGHDHLVILSNNRAAARLKIGEYKKCIEDCRLAIEMAQSGGDENCESEGVTINWREQIIKALYRKGDALENIEKYEDAINTYEEILRFEGQSRKVNQGLARCRRATTTARSEPREGSSPSKSSSSNTGSAFPGVDYSIFDITSAPAKKSPPSWATQLSNSDVEKSKAVAAMRAQAAKQEAEEAERLEKTDDVNARIQQWKAGKENNLRALLATLDTLLWPGAQWRGAQMSELIEPKRCKIIYLKAISKVHPDKLPSNVTTEQRMLASSIFSTLNEAWDSFKSQI